MSLWQPAAVGFHGKLPSRGDFVRAGLKRAFVDAWDEWLQHGIADSRARLGEEWLPAWLEAPIWHFALAAGLCGPDAAVGLFMPSVDRAGRHFPLAIVALAIDDTPRALAAAGAGFLAAAEEAGLAALEADLTPEALTAAVAAATRQPGGELPAALAACADRGSLWWTAGSPRVPAGVLQFPMMPQADAFAAMLMSSPAIAASSP